MILCRCEHPLDEEIKEKISLFCNVPRGQVIDLVNVEHSVYEVPIALRNAGLDLSISELLKLSKKQKNLEEQLKKIPEKISRINLLCHTKPTFKKKPEIFELQVAKNSSSLASWFKE